MIADTTLRIAGAIALETLALVVWNVGAYSPMELLPRLARLRRDPRALALHLFGFVVGLVFVAAATVLLIPAVGNAWDSFVPIEILTLGVALVLDFFVGNDVRRLLRLPTAES
ncbi:MAG TPA: hypothetical protein VME66_00725 [Candidatus Acidoferrales bacterium]|nr:hypothetical protein [Candidatus Acidoferrales bacterium]